MRCVAPAAILCLVMLASLPAGGEEASGDSLSAGERFHYLTGFGEDGYRIPEPVWGREWPMYKIYADGAHTRLPEPKQGSLLVAEAINARRSQRRFAAQPLSLEQLTGLLVAAASLTDTNGPWAFRAAPSGGALYPIEVYVVAHEVDSLPPGLYHYSVADTSLVLVRGGPLRDECSRAAHEQDAVTDAPATIILTARFERSTRKYAERGYRYVYIEAGAVCENLYLEVTSLGLGTVAIGSFNDAQLNDLLEIDGRAEAALLLMPVGVPR